MFTSKKPGDIKSPARKPKRKRHHHSHAQPPRSAAPTSSRSLTTLISQPRHSHGARNPILYSTRPLTTRSSSLGTTRPSHSIHSQPLATTAPSGPLCGQYRRAASTNTPVHISLAPPTLTQLDATGSPTPSSTTTPPGSTAPPAETPHPDRVDPTTRKLAWLNQRLHAPPPVRVRDEDLPDTIPNLNKDGGSFFSPKPYSYHFNEDLQVQPSAPVVNVNRTQARIDSLERELKLKAQQRTAEESSEEGNADTVPTSKSKHSVSPHTKKVQPKSTSQDVHGYLGDENEPPDNLGVEMDNRPDPEARAMFDEIRRRADKADADADTANQDPTHSTTTNHNTKKRYKHPLSSTHDGPDDADEEDNTVSGLDDDNSESDQSRPPNQSKLDKLFRYEDAEDSFLYDSIDPFAGRAEKRKRDQDRHQNTTSNRQKSIEEQRAEIEHVRELGEDVAQAIDFEPLNQEVANEVLSRQSLASYIMSKKAEILPPQARPVFWHGFTPYTDSHGTLIPGLDNLKPETPDLDWRTFLDFSQPHLWYPTARLLKRKIIFHTGPTNSGKTYRAMQRLKAAEKGLYSAPLRLLAFQNQEWLMQNGIPCSLLTGQDVIEVPKAQHVSSTVEMISLERVVDVAVIDEIQMIQDRDRGFAWTRALLGVPAKEVHVCGDATALAWLQEITAMTGEELHIHEYKRLSPLSIENEPVMGYQNLRKGDCVVAFSRNDVYSLKKKIEEFTGKRCAIIYGSLPPDIRKQQAKYFNEGEFDILVASDAIGMGLNLNIGRVVFSSIVKYDGAQFRRLLQTEVLQIAGRAGRFNTQFHHGFVNVMHVPEDLEYVREQFQSPLPSMEKAQLFPSTEHLLAFCEKFPQIKLSNYLNALPTRAKVGKLFEICDPQTMATLAEAVDDIEMPAYNRVMLCYAPLSPDKFKSHRPLLLELAKKLTEDAPIPIPKITYASRPTMPQTPAEVALLEETYSNLEAYIWLWFRLGDQLYSHRQAKIDKESCQKIILHYLLHS